MFSQWLRQAGRLAFDNRAAASIEYALVAVLIAIGSVAALTAMADSIIRIWTDVESEVVESISGAPEETGAGGLKLGNFKSKKNNNSGKKNKKGKKPKS